MVSAVMIGQRSRAWEYASLVASVVAVVALAAAYWWHQQVIQLTGDLAAANGQLQTLQQQLAAANNQSISLQQEVTQQDADLRRQSNVIQAEAKPDLPLSIGFRKAFLGPGLVMELRNNSGAQLEIAAAFTSPATGLTQQRSIVLPSNVVMQFGSAQGWAFVAGQRITFRNVNYRPAEVAVPQM